MRFQQTYNIGKSTLDIKFGDIATAATEVIVTSDDQQLSMGGGTSKAVRAAAGDSVYEVSRAFLPVPLGEVRVTSAGQLAAKGVHHIFHAAVIPSASERSVDDPRAIVRSATQQALELLQSLKLTRIALPALGTGFAGFDAQTSGAAMAEVIRDFLLKDATPAMAVEIWIWLGQKREVFALKFLSEITERAHLKPHAVPTHAVVLIHGIRTAAGWRERIGNEIEAANSTLTPVPVGYGLFGIVQFLLPIGPMRRMAAERVWRKMECCFKSPNIDRVSIVAHSFGTWITHYLLHKKDVKFHRVIFCGAVADNEIDWETVQRKVDDPKFTNAPTARIVNDCGTRDIWPMLAEFVTWGYSNSGRWGFQHAMVRDRFFPHGHSGFFQEGFATRHWVPALTGTHLTKGVVDGIAPPGWLTTLTMVKLPYILLGGALLWYVVA